MDAVTSFGLLLFWLLVSHAICDYPLQGEWMVRSKSRRTLQILSGSQRPDLIWIHVLSAHAMIHGGGVAVVMHHFQYSAAVCVLIGLAEFTAHWVIDFGKGEHWYGFHTDQFLHVACKLLWAVLALNCL